MNKPLPSIRRSPPKAEPLARLLRPSPPEFFPNAETIAVYDAERNIVFYRKDVYDTLTPIEQGRVRNLREKYLMLTPPDVEDFTDIGSYFTK